MYKYSVIMLMAVLLPASSLFAQSSEVTAVVAGNDENGGISAPVTIENPENRSDMQGFPTAFSIDDVDVDWDGYTFYGFDGAALRVVENPDKSAGNDSDHVLEYSKQESAEPWAGFVYHLERAVSGTDDAVFRLNIWSPRDGIDAQMKLETRDEQNSTGDLFKEVTLAEEWNTLEWDLSGINQDVAWDRVVVIMDMDFDNPPQGGARDTWYMDDFELAGVVDAGEPSDPGDSDDNGDNGDEAPDLVRVPLPVDFEDQSIDWANVFLGFEGAHVDVIENPHKDDDNDSDWVGRMVKDASIYWAGAFFWTEETFWFDEENNTITMDVWSPRRNVGINLKLEQSDGEGEHDSFAVTSTEGEWETMTWDYSGASPLIDWDQLTMIFDFHVGQDGDGGPDWTWYFDNIQVNHADPDSDRPEGPATPADLHPVSLPLDFDDEEFNWDFAFFGFDGGHASRVENPDQGDGNDSEWVGRMVKGSGPFWAGAFMHLEEPFSFDPDDPHVSMKVWSPRADVPVLMKVEQQDSGAEYEISSNTSTSVEWEVMQWDMSGVDLDTQWDVVVLIFDFQEGAEGDASEDFTWYFDRLEVNADESDLPTSTDDDIRNMPAAYELSQNYPNPFNPTTNIQFSLPEQADVTLEVFNVMGQRVAVLAGGVYQAGQHVVEFDASEMASGIYIYRLQAGSFTQTKKMMLVK
ncbi:T9SS type A sorting domain-containing protein [Balneolales bacterium ANBcel1]|nr:T9SS type A sorting domain-containing protein [Balneolales bacterium ANBcel1]